MNTTMTLILVNSALVTLFSIVSSRLAGWLEQQNHAYRPIGLGIAGGVTAIVAMQFPITIVPGLFMDLRSSAIAVCALMGGPVCAIFAAGIAITWRVLEGGIGAGAGALAILLAAGAGVWAGWRDEQAILSLRRIATMGLGLLILPQVTLLVIPSETWPAVFAVLPLLLPMQCLAALLAAIVIRSETLQRARLQEAKLYRTVIESMPETLTAKDRDGRFILTNLASATALGLNDPAQMIGKTDADFHSPELAARYRADEEAVFAESQPVHIEQSYETPTGAKGWYSTLKYPICDQQTGEIIALATHSRDISKQKELEQQLAESRQQLADALANMADGLVMFDRQGKLVYCNERYRSMFSKTADIRVPGADLHDIIAASRARGEETTPRDSDTILPEQAFDSLPVLPLVPGKREITLWDGRSLEAQTRSVGGGGSLIVFTDITRAKQAEGLLRHTNRALEKAAFTDGLTGLYNRRAFDVQLRQEFARSHRTGSGVSLLMIDIDHFKLFNDRYGHQAGDQCLRQIAATLRSVAKRSTDIAARYGGEEMALILSDTDLAGGSTVAEYYCQAVRDLHIPHGDSEKGIVTVSIGVAAVPSDDIHSSDDLIASADAALYQAKHSGRDRYVIASHAPVLDMGQQNRKPALAIGNALK
ncbi:MULTISPECIES: sensor domain-containing diguanylate cyclase [Rhizobium/Agrobacterium group]|uniref:sensor domain-containing diguanylate cyclase n=1 Tax=Rhizobium/Agrobacterium group TaxID=227290 RepID=UPI000B21E818|nr:MULTISPECIES: diguanylate cyclase [Rhizobium/Agrobacterium group]NSX94921.1 diguanylate cyclase [Agrobacterium vitis]NSZ26061.1 diguanylate cyclase [Agrobacterium vitis]UJL76164.1 diguanylate cyclase [Agrobacterium vitis]UJL81374.1 diguanylate cyclase [Agrobacterium vitis]